MSDTKVNRHFPTFIRAGHWTRAAARRLIRRTWKPAVALLLLVAVAHATATFVFGRRVEAEIAAIRARGEPVTLAEMAPHPVPDHQNAAVVFDRIARSVPPLGQKLPPGAEEALRYLGGDGPEPSPAAWQEVRQVLARHQPILEAAEEAARRPFFRPTAPNWWESPKTPACFAARWQTLGLVCLQAMAAARTGDRYRAVHAVEVLVRLATVHETYIMGFEGGITHVSHLLRDVAPRVVLPSADARHLYQLLANADLAGRQRWQLHHCRVDYILFFPRYSRYGPRALRYLTERYPVKPLIPFTAAEGYLLRPLTYLDQLTCLHDIQEVFDFPEPPYRGDRAMLLPNAGVQQPRGLLHRSFRPPPWYIIQFRLRAEAEVAGSRVFLALLAYHDRKGHYPQSLAELRAGLGWELPPDPFAGNDFHYRPEGKGFRLYSVGANLRDDGGERDFGPYATRAPKRSYRSPDEAADDIIWRME